jgi:hypothetical protein
MVTCDGAGASHDLLARLAVLASRRQGYQLIYSVGCEFSKRGKAAITAVPNRPDRSPSIRATKSASAAPMTPAPTAAAPTAGAGSRKPTSPS